MDSGLQLPPGAAKLNVTTTVTAYSKTENFKKCFRHPMESFLLHKGKIKEATSSYTFSNIW